jgi:hypothetical protein
LAKLFARQCADRLATPRRLSSRSRQSLAIAISPLSFVMVNNIVSRTASVGGGLRLIEKR